jgi:hypothetical protein
MALLPNTFYDPLLTPGLFDAILSGGSPANVGAMPGPAVIAPSAPPIMAAPVPEEEYLNPFDAEAYEYNAPSLSQSGRVQEYTPPVAGATPQYTQGGMLVFNTHQGGMGGFAAPIAGATYALIDNKTGEVITSGTGQAGLEQVWQASNDRSADMGKKANWTVVGVDPTSGRQFNVAEDTPPASALGIAADFVLPAIGGAIAGPLGAAAGSGVSSVAQGRSFEDTLLRAGITAGTAAVIGGAPGMGTAAGSGAGSAASSAAASKISPLLGEIIVQGTTAAVPAFVGSAAGSALSNLASMAPGRGVDYADRVFEQPAPTPPTSEIVVTAPPSALAPLVPPIPFPTPTPAPAPIPEGEIVVTAPAPAPEVLPLVPPIPIPTPAPAPAPVLTPEGEIVVTAPAPAPEVPPLVPPIPTPAPAPPVQITPEGEIVVTAPAPAPEVPPLVPPIPIPTPAPAPPVQITPEGEIVVTAPAPAPEVLPLVPPIPIPTPAPAPPVQITPEGEIVVTAPAPAPEVLPLVPPIPIPTPAPAPVATPEGNITVTGERPGQFDFPDELAALPLMAAIPTVAGGQFGDPTPKTPDSGNSLLDEIIKYYTLASGGLDLLGGALGGGGGGGAGRMTPYVSQLGPMPTFTRGAFTPFGGDYETYGFGPEFNFFGGAPTPVPSAPAFGLLPPAANPNRGLV